VSSYIVRIGLSNNNYGELTLIVSTGFFKVPDSEAGDSFHFAVSADTNRHSAVRRYHRLTIVTAITGSLVVVCLSVLL